MKKFLQRVQKKNHTFNLECRREKSEKLVKTKEEFFEEVDLIFNHNAKARKPYISQGNYN